MINFESIKTKVGNIKNKFKEKAQNAFSNYIAPIFHKQTPRLKKLKVFFVENFILTHFAICFIGFILFMTTFLVSNTQAVIVDYYTPFKFYFFPTKGVEIITYMFGVSLSGLLFFIYILIYKKHKKLEQKIKDLSPHFLNIVIWIDLLFNIAITQKIGHGAAVNLIIMILWFVLLFFPFKINKYKERLQKIKKLKSVDLTKHEKFITHFFIFCIIINIFVICKPFIMDRLFIYNEFENVPTQTLMKHFKDKDQETDNQKFGLKKDITTKEKSRKYYIDEISFKESLPVYGYRKYYDVRNPKKDLSGINCAEVSDISIKDHLNKFIDDHYEKTIFRPLFSMEELWNKFAQARMFVYFYAEGNKLCTIYKLMPNEIEFFKNNISPKYKKDFNKFVDVNYNIPKIKEYPSSRLFVTKYPTTIKEMEYFRKKNGTPHVFYWFHHHNHILSSIIKINSGVPQNETFAQYGYGTSLTLNYIMNHLNGFNLNDYTHIMHTFRCIYYFLLVAVVFLIFRNKIVALCCLGLSFIALDSFSYVHYYMAPGANPIRHFFDIPVILALYYYYRNNSKINLLLADILCVSGIFLYPIYGIYLALALIGTSIIRQFVIRISLFEIINAIALLSIGGCCYIAFSSASSDILTSFLDGVSGFLAGRAELILIFIAIIASYILFMKSIKLQTPYRDLLLFISFYMQLFFTYYMTISEITHFLVVAPILIIGITIAWSLFKEIIAQKVKINFGKFEYITMLGIFAILLLYSFPNYLIQVCDAKSTAKYHLNHEWNLPEAQFTSDMNPEYYIDSIELLKNPKYSDNNRIYMISEYDNFLPLMAGKYNDLLYIDLMEYIATPRKYNLVKEKLLYDKPEYIFVDTFLTSGKIENVVNRNFFDISLLKYYKLKTLAKLFNEIKIDYEPVEQTTLLTLWKRRNK